MGSDKERACTEHAIEVPVGGPSDDAASTHIPTFGVRVPGVTCEQRCAAYAVIRNRLGAVAAVHVPAGYWLPGGGMLPGETPEETVVREVREELGCTLRLVSKIGQAVQYCFAADEGWYYAMQAVFFRAEFAEESRGSAEYELCWLDVSHPGPLFFHACHDWAVRQG
jgi:8-oxo-dGTP diphosphatase